MTCPECGADSWNYEPGTRRCPSGHVFATVAVEGVQERVVRVDLPSARERFKDFALGMSAAGALFVVVEVAQRL